MFEFVLGKEMVNKSFQIKKRTAIRAVIFDDDKLLMIQTNKGDYKFPGGGTKIWESIADTLKREVREETGYLVNFVGRTLGSVKEQSEDKFESNKYFLMESVYVVCKIDKFNKEKQELDEYEKEQGFIPVYVTIGEAIKCNKKVLKRGNINANPWVKRETLVLEKLRCLDIK